MKSTLSLMLSVVALATLAACASPDPTVSPLRLPTRIPSTPNPTSPSAGFYYEVGLAHRAAGNTARALEAFSQALALDPTLGSAYVERGAAYLALGNPDAALTDAQAALAVDPEDAAAHALLGEVLLQGFGDPVQGLIAYQKAVRLDPDLGEATFLIRWRAAVEGGQAGRMIALANEYLNANPDDPLEAYYRGEALSALGNSSAAIRTLSEALEGGGPAALWFALGDAYSTEGAWVHAVTCYEGARALAETGDDSLSHVSDTPAADLFGALGTAYFHSGRCTDAQTMLNHALAMGPDRQEYHTLIGQAMICQTPTPTPTPYPWMR
ncbi:MAG: tetratricopeptide repeat protein [Anaerolineae bacterium]|jgi:tetratricopeptide (TPR) repeat protein